MLACGIRNFYRLDGEGSDNKMVCITERSIIIYGVFVVMRSLSSSEDTMIWSKI